VETINAFILAAGFGKRLGPITDHIPKPLLPILGKPVLETVLERISCIPVNKIAINAHHKREMFRDWLSASRYAGKIELLFEDVILGTGGALKSAETFLRETFFLVHNGDIISDINLRDLIAKHCYSGNTVTLAVHNRRELNNVWIDNKGCVRLVGKTSGGTDNRLHPVAFMGIAVYSPEFLEFLPQGKSSIVDSWRRAASSGLRVGTEDFTGNFWSDIGTPDSYSTTVFEILKKEGETVYVDPTINCGDVYMGANTVIEKGCFLEGHASLRNCILLPGSKLTKGIHRENSIIGPTYLVRISESSTVIPSQRFSWLSRLFSSSADAIHIIPIGVGGSDRSYYRIRAGKETVVVMECSEKDPDYKRHLIYTLFFRRHSIPVPELLWDDNDTLREPDGGKQGVRYAVFEDLGDFSLYARLRCIRTPEKLERLYRMVLDILVNLHTVVTKNVSECPPLNSRIFDYEHLRWETNYFIERFVCGLAKMDIRQEHQALSAEFDCLAREVDSFRKTIVHRDFQSQNIMSTEDNVLRIIDYQGARMGPPAYDLASVLWDPYFALDDALRNRLLDYYIDNMTDRSASLFDKDEFRQTIIPCRLQRHMQALGAYGFLSQVKGKRYFLRHIPQALRYLSEETELAHAHYPVLCEVVKSVNEKTGY
jgi:NDP-sugar pyrophosphorylase family protein/aminoglycoside/choline kinase family phosphotransferase